MPRLSPPDPASGYHSHNQPGARTPLTAPKKTTRNQKSRASAIRQEVDRNESKYWHNRFISYCKSKINRLINPPASFDIQNLVDRPTKKGSKQNPLKIIAALNLHTGSNLPLNQVINGKIAGKIAVETKKIEAVIHSAELNGVELAYEYLHKGKSLPAGYLQQILLPHLSGQVVKAIKGLKASHTPLTRTQQAALRPDNARQLVNQLAKKVKLLDEQSFSFEKILELKKEIRNTIVKSIDEQKSLHTQQSLKQKNKTRSSNPFHHTELDRPKKNRLLYRKRRH